MGKVFLEAINSENKRKTREMERTSQVSPGEEKKIRGKNTPPPPKKNIGKIEKVCQKREKSKQKPNPHPPPKKIQGCRMLLGGALYIFMCQAWWTIRSDIDAWVDCKFCGDRFHIRCTNLPVPDDLGDHLIIPAIFVP